MDLDYRRLGKQYKKALMTYTRDEIVFALGRNIMPWESPLHTAVRQGNLFNVKTLVTEKNVNSRSSWGFTPLNVACYCGHVEIIEFLLASGADIRLDDGEGWTPLHAACRSDQTAAVKLLLERGAGDCVNTKATGNRETPLCVTCKSKGDPNGDIVELLVGAGANVNARDSKGRTPLMLAASKGRYKKVEHLLNVGPDVHAVDVLGCSALHMAVAYPAIIRLLLDSGANVNLRNNREEVPLERKNISIEAMPVLLEHGAGVDVLCRRHKTCKCSVLKCQYKSAYSTAKRGRGCDKLNVLEKHIIKLETARLDPGQGVALINPPLEIDYWNSISRDEFRVDCETELAMMKTDKILGTSSTYLDALLQRPYTLTTVDPVSLKHCREKFPIYGELIWTRFLSGRRKRPLIDESIDFFSVAEDVPLIPPECVEEILSYLSETDLNNLVSIYNSAVRRRSSSHQGLQEQNDNNKRANLDSSLQVMKYLKVA